MITATPTNKWGIAILKAKAKAVNSNPSPVINRNQFFLMVRLDLTLNKNMDIDYDQIVQMRSQLFKNYANLHKRVLLHVDGIFDEERFTPVIARLYDEQLDEHYVVVFKPTWFHQQLAIDKYFQLETPYWLDFIGDMDIDFLQSAALYHDGCGIEEISISVFEYILKNRNVTLFVDSVDFMIIQNHFNFIAEKVYKIAPRQTTNCKFLENILDIVSHSDIVQIEHHNMLLNTILQELQLLHSIEPSIQFTYTWSQLKNYINEH